jgi:hypothetical protein
VDEECVDKERAPSQVQEDQSDAQVESRTDATISTDDGDSGATMVANKTNDEEKAVASEVETLQERLKLVEQRFAGGFLILARTLY